NSTQSIIIMISVVIPLLNEEKLVTRLLTEVRNNLELTGEDSQIVCVDDGSSDSTLQKLIQFKAKNDLLKIISLSRNFGLQPALTAGIDYAKGDFIIIMDGDFQDPPELIPVLFDKIKATDADIVSAVRESRHEKFTKKITINIFHRIFDKLTGEQQVSQTGNFCIINRKAHKAMLQFSERNRYIPGIRNFIGFKHEFILYDR